MANRNWRSGGYNTYNQLLQPVTYFAQPLGYTGERKQYTGNYHDERRNRKDFQGGRRDRNSPIKRRSSPYQRSHDSHGSFRKDVRKSHATSGRHESKTPRLSLDVKELSNYSLKQRYSRLYCPSDFFHTNLTWQEVFPLYRPMRLGNTCDFQIINKEVDIEGWEPNSSHVVAEDADNKYSVRVMLLSTPNLTELYKLSSKLKDGKSSRAFLAKSINFLVGNRVKNDSIAIGGAWSPSLDGNEPESNPKVLINTAIRTCKALTGIDLSKCKKWFKFMEIHYYRCGEESDKKEISAELKEDRIETSVIFIPDVWSCLPSEQEWDDIKKKFSEKLSSIIGEEDKLDDVSVSNKSNDNLDVSMKSCDDESSQLTDKKDDQNVDLNNYKVAELKAMLAERGLDNKGIKNVLIKRLSEVMEQERLTENDTKEEKTETVIENDVEVKDDVKSEEPSESKIEVENKKDDTENVVKEKKMTEKEKERWTKVYTLPDKPCLLIRPNYSYEKYDCAVQSLDTLLGYRFEDQKESTFELSLFCEQFHEMIQRDSLFYIYRSLINLPEIQDHSEEPESKKVKLDGPSVIRKTKMTPDMHLMFSFSVIDQDNLGYIRDHILEYLIHNIGLNLSRSQVKKLLNKIPSKKGSLMYTEVATREVIEGSVDDIAMLKLQIEKMQKLAILSRGNKAFFEDGEVEELITREGQLELLDKLEEIECKKKSCELQLSVLLEEIERLKSIINKSSNVVSELVENIEKTKEKLIVEKETYSKLESVNGTYHSILKSARDLMEQSVSSIMQQYEKEKEIKEAEKQAQMEKEAALALEKSDENNESKTEMETSENN